MKTRELILVGLFAALTAIGAFLKIPIPLVPVTLQYVFCAFSGILLGKKLGLYSQLLYVGLGLVGLPIFTEGGGPAYIYHRNFGYLLGFILCATIIGHLVQKVEEYNFFNLLKCVIPGLIAVYMIGIPYFYMIKNYYIKESVPFKGLLIVMTPFIIKDIILSCIIALTATRVIPSLKRAGYFKVHNKKVA